MPTPTYTPLATVTLGSSASSVTFSSIPATYRDLVLVSNGTATGSGNLFYRFNSDTGTNYSRVLMFGTGSTTGTFRRTSETSADAGSFFAGQNITVTQLMDYSATDKHKTFLTRNNTPSDFVIAFANRWANTAAITSVQLNHTVSSFAAGCTFSLYGIVA